MTASGKTEVYLRAIAAALERKTNALVLVPEISLTPQLEARFREAFPEARLALLHSALEDVARTSAWLAAARGEAGVVLGTRLALLAPIPRLALIVVDEEHDASFKQHESGFQYNEKWVYDRPKNEPSRPKARQMYWQRYDFVASERVERDGHKVPESPSELLARLA